MFHMVRTGQQRRPHDDAERARASARTPAAARRRHAADAGPGSRVVAASRRVRPADPSVARRRLGPHDSSSPRRLRSAGVRATPARQRLRLPRRARTCRSRRGRARPGAATCDPAGVAGRLDLPTPERPSPGGGYGFAVPVSARLEHSARAGEGRAQFSPAPCRSYARPWRSTWQILRLFDAPPPPVLFACWTLASSGSAARNTPTGTAPTGTRQLEKRHVRLLRDDRLVLLFEIGQSLWARRSAACMKPLRS